MESNKNKYIAVAYRLYVVDNNSNELVEEATDNEPFQFISGYGITLDAFENATVGLNKGEEFDITLSKDEAYGDYEEEHVLDLDKNIFCINGHFDHDNIYKDAIIPLQNEDGNRFLAKVVSVGEDKVRVDLNHPLAGKTLNFKGHIVESREATNEDSGSYQPHERRRMLLRTPWRRRRRLLLRTSPRRWRRMSSRTW